MRNELGGEVKNKKKFGLGYLKPWPGWMDGKNRCKECLQQSKPSLGFQCKFRNVVKHKLLKLKNIFGKYLEKYKNNIAQQPLSGNLQSK